MILVIFFLLQPFFSAHFFNFVTFQVAFYTIEVSSWNAAEISDIKPEDYIILSQRDQTLKILLKGKGGKMGQNFVFVLFSMKTSLLSKTSELNYQLSYQLSKSHKSKTSVSSYSKRSFMDWCYWTHIASMTLGSKHRTLCCKPLLNLLVSILFLCSVLLYASTHKIFSLYL